MATEIHAELHTERCADVQLQGARAVVGAMVACAVFVVGCGSDESAITVSVPVTTGTESAVTQPADADPTLVETTVGETTVASTAAPVTTVAGGNLERLRSLLPTLDEMPAGWSEGPADEDDEEGTDCLDLAFATMEPVAEADASASVSFSQSQFGPFLIFAATHASNVGDLNVLADQVAACNGTTDSDGYTWSVLPLSFPKLGDETFAMRADGTGQMFPATVQIVFVKQGDFALMAAGAGIGGAVTDVALMESVLRSMVDRAG